MQKTYAKKYAGRLSIQHFVADNHKEKLGPKNTANLCIRPGQ
jgi:hypothetical protein